MTGHRKDASPRTSFRIETVLSTVPGFARQASLAALVLAASLSMAQAQQSAQQGDAAKPADQGGSRQIVVEDKQAAPAANSRIQVLPPAGSAPAPQAQDEPVSPNAAAARAAREAEQAPPPPNAQQAAPPPPNAQKAAEPAPPPSAGKQAAPAPAPQGEPQAATAAACGQQGPRQNRGTGCPAAAQAREEAPLSWLYGI